MQDPVESAPVIDGSLVVPAQIVPDVPASRTPPPYAVGRALRRSILELLRAGPLTAGAITEALERRRPCVSHHLTILREEGRVTVQHKGRYRIYTLAGRDFR